VKNGYKRIAAISAALSLIGGVFSVAFELGEMRQALQNVVEDVACIPELRERVVSLEAALSSIYDPIWRRDDG